MSIRSKPSTDAYRDGWERTFRTDHGTCHICGQAFTESRPRTIAGIHAECLRRRVPRVEPFVIFHEEDD